ncbi:MAG: 7TM domain-containing protein [Candidatus Moranbacteria bacterium]|nr:7TM domain-containing protein [Candidatus Moranbacteria bacterium]
MYSSFVEFATSQGVPLSTVTLILMLPVVVALIAFFRQVIGIKAFGIYTPALIIFAFLAIKSDSGSFWGGIKYGVAIFATVIVVGTIARIILKQFRLLYLPRVAIVISIVALSTLLMLVFGGALQRTGLAAVSIFPILIMITLVEKFVAAQIEKGNKAAVVLSLETLVITIAGYFIASWPMLILYLQKYPWLVFIAIGLNVLLGKWTGLRLSEYIRFKKVIKNV